jgi:hypothetical protein
VSREIHQRVSCRFCRDPWTAISGFLHGELVASTFFEPGIVWALFGAWQVRLMGRRFACLRECSSVK